MSRLPPRYWIWQTVQGNVYRIQAKDAERICTQLDQITTDSVQPHRQYIEAVDCAGSEIRLNTQWCESFYEITTEIKAATRTMNKEAAEEAKDWEQP